MDNSSSWVTFFYIFFWYYLNVYCVYKRLDVSVGVNEFFFCIVWGCINFSTMVISSSSLPLLHQLWPVCFIRLTWIVCKMGGTWSNCSCFVGCYSSNLFRIARSIFVLFPSNFLSKSFVRFNVVQPYSSTDTATSWKNSYFILSKRPDFRKLIINRLSTLTSIFEDKIL